MLKGRTLGWLLLIMILLLVTGCGRETKPPIEVIELNAFRVYDSGEKIGIYFNWKNVSEDKVIDALTLSVCSDQEEQPFECQCFEPDGIVSGACNKDQLFFIDENEVSLKDAKVLSIVVSEVCFTDGSAWEGSAQGLHAQVEVDGHKGEGEFPVRVNTLHFYEDGGVENLYPSIKLQVDWSNSLKTDNVIYVLYKLIAKSGDGEVICLEDGQDAIYLPKYFHSYEQVFGVFDYCDIRYLDGPTVSLLHENNVLSFEMSVCKVVSSKGVVWDNPDPSSGIEVVVNGRKGFAFDNNCSNESVQELIERIEEEAGKQGVDLGIPQVFIKEWAYCLLRYADVDVRVELSWDNQVSPYQVRFAFYAQPSDMEPEVWLQDLRERMEPLRLCICAAVLTDLPYTEVLQKVADYNQNDRESVEFDGTTYASYEGIYLYDNEAGDTGLFAIFAVGRGFSDASQALYL
ncbi:MAG: hypothetical protein NC543_06620 [bacterium]|nr:hypothetical protein [bacterium]